MGNWRLKRQVDDGDEIIYKFSPKFVLKAGQSVTVRNGRQRIIGVFDRAQMFSGNSNLILALFV